MRRKTEDGRDGQRRCVGMVVGALLLTSLVSSLTSAQSTRAERSNYAETSTHADVIAFLDSLERLYPGKLARGTIGSSVHGLAIPYVVAARPLVSTPEQARATGKPIVYVQGNIHGGEVEGKESLQAILRDLVRDPRPNVLDSIVLIAVPIYNADGNEAFGPQERMRGSQNGPAMVGNRANAENFDLNRDYLKVETPETAGSLQMFNAWDPDVFVDLHTTNGSYHGYGITYSPSLHPAAMLGTLAPAGAWTRDTLLPALRRRSGAKGVESFDYGNFSGPNNTRDDATSLTKGGWLTYEHKPRFGTNYYGLRNRASVLVEAYSHDPFKRRVDATTVFVRELLSYVGEHRAALLARTRAAGIPSVGTMVPIRARMTTTPFTAPVLVEALENAGDSVRHEAGLRPGFKRTFRYVPVDMPVYDRFEGTRTRAMPEGWVVDQDFSEAIDRLRAHGVEVISLQTAVQVAGERFVVDSVARAARPFQGHQEISLEGRWVAESIEIPANGYFIPANQALGLLAMILLEPESDDGLTTWNFFDEGIAVGSAHPVRRILERFPTPPASLR